ncbi:MAG: hypothetical protein LBK91_05655, partial [Synergistaceae bacterium]|nr:hypothetical protein [Synergistaceae bacterium]
EGIKEGRQEGMIEGIKEGRQEGIKEGRQEGMIEGIRETARSMLARNLPLTLISEISGLSAEEIEDLKKIDKDEHTGSPPK